MVTRNKKVHNRMRKESIHQEDTILSMYAVDITAPKYIKQM